LGKAEQSLQAQAEFLEAGPAKARSLLRSAVNDVRCAVCFKKNFDDPDADPIAMAEAIK
jgi:hypothetical protein